MEIGTKVRWSGVLYGVIGPLRQNITKDTIGIVTQHYMEDIFWVRFDGQDEAMTMHVKELTVV
jgi:hypothetical protein